LRFEKRAGVSEIVSSLAMLMITIALLGAIGVVALESIRGSGSLLSSSSQGAARDYGVLLSLVSVQSNASGTFAWVYNFGWVQGSISGAYIDGGAVAYVSSCGAVVEPETLCAFSLPAGDHGEASLVFGAKSLEYAV
jgi:hypothetical protein